MRNCSLGGKKKKVRTSRVYHPVAEGSEAARDSEEGWVAEEAGGSGTGGAVPWALRASWLLPLSCRAAGRGRLWDTSFPEKENSNAVLEPQPQATAMGGSWIISHEGGTAVEGPVEFVYWTSFSRARCALLPFCGLGLASRAQGLLNE